MEPKLTVLFHTPDRDNVAKMQVFRPNVKTIPFINLDFQDELLLISTFYE